MFLDLPDHCPVGVMALTPLAPTYLNAFVARFSVCYSDWGRCGKCCGISVKKIYAGSVAG